MQFRNDDVMQVALYHTEARQRLETWNDASAIVTSLGVYGENQVEWARWPKTSVGLRADGMRYDVTNRVDARNGGTETAGIISPKGTATFGPWRSTEFYVNAGTGFHSNSALGTTLRYDSAGDQVSAVTPLASRLPGEPLGGVDDIHVHPAVPRTLRVSLVFGFLRLGDPEKVFMKCSGFADVLLS